MTSDTNGRISSVSSISKLYYLQSSYTSVKTTNKNNKNNNKILLNSRSRWFAWSGCRFQPVEPDGDHLLLRSAIVFTSTSSFTCTYTGRASRSVQFWRRRTLCASPTSPSLIHPTHIEHCAPSKLYTFSHESIRVCARVPRGGMKNWPVPSLIDDMVSNGLALMEDSDCLTSSTGNQRASSNSDLSTSRGSSPLFSRIC